MLEQLWYESYPIYYAALALFLLMGHRNYVTMFAAAVLLIASLLILRRRWKHRTS